MASKNVVKVKLVSQGVHEDGPRKGKKTGYYKTTTRRKDVPKLLLMKYDPILRKYVEFKEGKIK